MGQQDQTEVKGDSRPLLSIPHVDYARGDGISIGPGQPETWSPVVISDDVPWVDKYRGLWGLDTRDFSGGERAPSGPKYNRDGSVRQSWYDPLGWAGMDKVPPPPQIPIKMQERVTDLQQQLATFDAQIAEKRLEVGQLELDIVSLRSSEYGERIAEERDDALSAGRKALDALQRQRVAAEETIGALRSMLAHGALDEAVSPTAHLRAIHHPEPPPPPHSRIVDIWAAVSGALALLALALLLFFRPPFWLALIVAVLLVFGAIEAATRGRLTNFLLSTTIVLAVVAVAILVFEFWQLILVLIIVVVVIFMIVDNLRELRQG
jgi:hypothetical protein